MFLRYWTLKRIGFTTLTFQGHATSSFTLPFHSPLVVLWTLNVSLTVSEMCNGECDAVSDMTLNDL